jgi:hypothetical protein
MSAAGRPWAPKTTSPGDLAKKGPATARSLAPSGGIPDGDFLSQEQFRIVVRLEQKRTGRSQRSFVLMRVAAPRLWGKTRGAEALAKVVAALTRSSRDTDIKGWYEEGSVIGVIFTEIAADADRQTVTKVLLNQTTAALSTALSPEQIHEISLAFDVFPDDWYLLDEGDSANEVLHPEHWIGADFD